MTAREVSGRAWRVHKEAIVIDMLEAMMPAIDVRYFGTLVEAGVTAVHATIPDVTDDLPTAIKNIAKFYKIMEGSPEAKIALSGTDIEKAKEEGKSVIIAGMQESIPFEGNLDIIRIFHMLGVRVMQIAYFQQGYLGAGCAERVDHGLTDRGREAIKELNRLGILIDVSHCGDRTARDTAEASVKPIAITHSIPASLVDHPRAKSDETIRAIAQKDGVMGLTILTSFCERKDKVGIEPTLSDFVGLIDYVVDLVGVSHVGLGSDLAPFWKKEEYEAWHKAFGAMRGGRKARPFEERTVEGFTISDTIKVTEELLKHGYSDDETKKVLGGNWLRLVKEVWGG